MSLASPLDVFPATVDDPDVAALLMRHHAMMRAQSPAESCHVQTLDELERDGARVFACRRGGALLGVGALKPLGNGEAELKSMHVATEARGQGAGRALLLAILSAARASGHNRISLETGTAPPFAAARALYAAQGFVDCPPFGCYSRDPLSVFMTRAL
ncbi:GNAT family N-acetyltransferase [Marinovum sp.]|uniref:GNAT family N-acetyltransferase n=1 Tax=Marinovum sp. TaxID=2024839 RepID=UPI003A9162B0